MAGPPVILFYLVIVFITIWNYFIILLFPSPPGPWGQGFVDLFPTVISASKKWQILRRCSRSVCAKFSLSWKPSGFQVLCSAQAAHGGEVTIRPRQRGPAESSSLYISLLAHLEQGAACFCVISLDTATSIFKFGIWLLSKYNHRVG